MATHADPERGRMCTASVATIGLECGLGRRAVQRTIRQLEIRRVILPMGHKRGGRHCETTPYQFNISRPPSSTTERVSLQTTSRVSGDAQKALKDAEGDVSLAGHKSRERETAHPWAFINYKRKKMPKQNRYRRKRLTTRLAGKPRGSGI